MVNFNMKDILAFCGINSKTSGKLLHMGGGGGGGERPGRRYRTIHPLSLYSSVWESYTITLSTLEQSIILISNN